MKAISIIVPTLNESENIALLVDRIATAFKDSDVKYEMVFVDDRSKDDTVALIKSYTGTHPIRVYSKVGPRGKAYSLLQGFKLAKYDILCMLDADLQYPPEAILPMYNIMLSNGVDVVLSERYDAETSKLRQLSSTVYNLVFTRMLFGFNYDTQSGLKLFKKEVAEKASLNPTPWSFDLEFIVRALENNFKILSYKIVFAKRYGGEAKVRVLKVTYELASASLKLRLNSSPRKIKQAYRMNLEIAARTVGTFAVATAGIMAAATIAATALPGHASALSLPVDLDIDIPTLPVDPTVIPIDPGLPNGSTPTVTQPTTPPVGDNNGSVSNGDTSLTTATGDANPVAYAAANSAGSGTVELADKTYPFLSSQQTYTYGETSSPISTNLAKVWLSTAIAFLIAGAAYILLSTYRNTPASARIRAKVAKR